METLQTKKQETKHNDSKKQIIKFHEQQKATDSAQASYCNDGYPAAYKNVFGPATLRSTS